MKNLEVIVPCYNEEESIAFFERQMEEIFALLPEYRCSILYVNDGSKDGTYQIIKNSSAKKQYVNYISFARNFGKEAAMFAGLFHSAGDFVVVMDADLQHPPELIPQMLDGIKEGYDCCMARRINRKGENIIRQKLSKTFYRIMNLITSIDLVQGSTDYCLMTRQMVDAVLSLHERERFTKGIFQWVGFQKKYIEYENTERIAGESKWSFRSLFRYAISGITAFSVTPLHLASAIGIVVMLAAFIYALYIFGSALSSNAARTGFASIIIILLFLGGMIIFLLGVIGEYLSKIYIEVKQRPAYIIRDTSLKTTERKKQYEENIDHYSGQGDQ